MGISGPRFLLIYVALLAVTVAGVVLARRRALADGLGFARDLARHHRLSGDARVEALLAAARLSPGPLRLAATLAGRPPRLVVLARVPGLGERALSLPLGPPRAG